MNPKAQKAIRPWFVIVGAIALFTAQPTKVYACACCANGGDWYQRTEKLESFQFDELNGLKFSPSAQLYLTAAGFETVKGISSPSESYTVSHSKNKRFWNLRFTDQQGKTGNLSFTLPENVVVFGTDLFDQPTADSRLYKELRIEGKVSGNGIFAPGMGGDTRYRLVLQGRGNYCLNRGDFKRWTLQILGSRASYSFYGSFE